LLPDVADAPIGDGGVDHGVVDALVPHERLQRPGVDTATSERIAGCMAEHVRVDRERKVGGLAEPLDQLLGAVDRQRRLALAQEQMPAVFAVLPDHGAKQPQLIAL